MLTRVLFVLLVGVPACRGAVYSAYYDADGDIEKSGFYDRYNEELRAPRAPPVMTTVVEALTRFTRIDIDDIRTLNPEEIIDVKGALRVQYDNNFRMLMGLPRFCSASGMCAQARGVLNNILQGKKPESLREHRAAREYTDTYDYLEIFNKVKPEHRTGMGPVQKWLPAGAVQNLQPTVQENTADSSDDSITEQYWTFVYQPETSTNGKNDVMAAVKENMLERLGEMDQRRPTIELRYWRPTHEVTWSTTDETEDEVTVMYPQESTTYSNLDMQAEVRKLVQHWSPSTKEIEKKEVRSAR